jgi:hypothetical protein
MIGINGIETKIKAADPYQQPLSNDRTPRRPFAFIYFLYLICTIYRPDAVPAVCLMTRRPAPPKIN